MQSSFDGLTILSLSPKLPMVLKEKARNGCLIKWRTLERSELESRPLAFTARMKHIFKEERILVTKIAIRIESIHVTMIVIGMKIVHTSLSLYNHSKVTSCGAHLGAELENSETGGEKSKEEWSIMKEESTFRWPPKVETSLNYRMWVVWSKGLIKLVCR